MDGAESILRGRGGKFVVEAVFDATVIDGFPGFSMCDARNDDAELNVSALCTRLGLIGGVHASFGPAWLAVVFEPALLSLL